MQLLIKFYCFINTSKGNHVNREGLITKKCIANCYAFLSDGSLPVSLVGWSCWLLLLGGPSVVNTVLFKFLTQCAVLLRPVTKIWVLEKNGPDGPF